MVAFANKEPDALYWLQYYIKHSFDGPARDELIRLWNELSRNKELAK
jgi:hypothetical protein